LSSTQIDALTSTQKAALQFTSPMVLDLNGDGVTTTSISGGVSFDLKADGNKLATGWVGKDDGLLAIDLNGDGKINDGSELFGNGTTLADGTKAEDGYQAMKALDSNADGVLNAKDAAFGNLKVWVDANGDGITDAGELSSLSDKGIVELNLNANKGASFNNGNLVGASSSFTTGDGQSHAMADVWFQTSSLAAGVSNLTQAMASFNAQPAAAAGSLKLDAVGSGTTLAASAGQLADALRQFNSQLSAQPMADTESQQRLKALQQTGTGAGFLAATK
jgi:hypothetical protein